MYFNLFMWSTRQTSALLMSCYYRNSGTTVQALCYKDHLALCFTECIEKWIKNPASWTIRVTFSWSVPCYKLLCNFSRLSSSIEWHWWHMRCAECYKILHRKYFILHSTLEIFHPCVMPCYEWFMYSLGMLLLKLGRWRDSDFSTSTLLPVLLLIAAQFYPNANPWSQKSPT